MQKFCHNCGKQVNIGSKFCAECGTSLGSLSATPPAKQSNDYQPVMVNKHDDDYDPIDSLTHLNIRQNKLHVDIIPDRMNTETVGAAVLGGQQTGPIQGEEIKRDGIKVDSKQFLADFAKEAGTLRHD